MDPRKELFTSFCSSLSGPAPLEGACSSGSAGDVRAICTHASLCQRALEAHKLHVQDSCSPAGS